MSQIETRRLHRENQIRGKRLYRHQQVCFGKLANESG
jgi:hypothetical protein